MLNILYMLNTRERTEFLFKRPCAYLSQFAISTSLRLIALFAEDTAERFELTLKQWKSRPWYNKVSERILAPLRFMM